MRDRVEGDNACERNNKTVRGSERQRVRETMSVRDSKWRGRVRHKECEV